MLFGGQHGRNVVIFFVTQQLFIDSRRFRCHIRRRVFNYDITPFPLSGNSNKTKQDRQTDFALTHEEEVTVYHTILERLASLQQRYVKTKVRDIMKAR